MRPPRPHRPPRRSRSRPVRRVRRAPAWFRRRSTLASWTVALVLAAATGSAVAAVASRAQEALDAWGTTRVVAVATRPLRPGERVATGDLAWRSWPAGVLPDDAVVEGTPLDGRAVAQPIEAGEAVTAGRLAPDGLAGAAALVPAGTEAITVPPSTHRLPAQVRDRVDVWRAGDRAAVGASPAATLVARAATVVDAADDGSTTIAVTRAEAPAVASAVADGTVVLALVGP